MASLVGFRFQPTPLSHFMKKNKHGPCELLGLFPIQSDYGNNVSEDIPQLESQLLPKQYVSPFIGDHVAKTIISQLESQLLLPNFHWSSTIEDHLRNNSFSEMEPQLLPNQHLSSNLEDFVAKSMFFKIECQHLANRHLASNTNNHAAKSFASEVRPLLPTQQDELINCNELDCNSFSTLQSSSCSTPGSSYASSFSNDLASWLDHNPFFALQSPIHLLPGSSYSSSCSYNSNNGPDRLNFFSTLLVAKSSTARILIF